MFKCGVLPGLRPTRVLRNIFLYIRTLSSIKAFIYVFWTRKWSLVTITAFLTAWITDQNPFAGVFVLFFSHFFAIQKKVPERKMFVTCWRVDEDISKHQTSSKTPCFPITGSFPSFHILMTTSHQTPSDWLSKYSAVRRRAGKGCLGDAEEEEEEWWWRPRSEVWLLWWWWLWEEEGGGGGGSRRDGGTAEDLMGTMRVSMTSQSTCIIIS